MRKICVFDLDGTMVDSAGLIVDATVSYLEEMNISYPDGFIESLTPLGYMKSAELFAEMGVPGTPQEIYDTMMDTMTEVYAHDVKLKPGVEAALRQMKAQGTRLYVLTASPHGLTDVCLKHNGVYDLFDTVWSVEDFGMTKDDVRIYARVGELIGCAPNDICFFDDNLTALTTAKKAGWCCTAVYDRQTPEQFAAMTAVCDRAIRSFEDLLEKN